MSIFERKPGEDICDSCGVDAAEYGRLLNEVERLKEFEVWSENQRAKQVACISELEAANITQEDRVDELEGALEKIAELDSRAMVTAIARAALSRTSEVK